MEDCVPIDVLRKSLERVKQRLSKEKTAVLELHPLTDSFNREEYAFHYVRAERLGLRAITRRLSDLAFLPMQLDPKTEILSDSRECMKRWVTASLALKPGSHQFGNDFIHALTRCSLEKGATSPQFFKLNNRIANLFRDLSCLVGLLYYCSWMDENKIEAIGVTDPEDLMQTAEEIADLMQSPEIYRHIRAREQDDERITNTKKPKQRLIAQSRDPSEKAKVTKELRAKPTFYVIDNPHFIEKFDVENRPQ